MSDQNIPETPETTPGTPESGDTAPPAPPVAKKATRPRKKAAAKPPAEAAAGDPASDDRAATDSGPSSDGEPAPVAKKATRPRKKAAAKPPAADDAPRGAGEDAPSSAEATTSGSGAGAADSTGDQAPAAEAPAGSGAPMVLFQAPARPTTTTRSRTRKTAAKKTAAAPSAPTDTAEVASAAEPEDGGRPRAEQAAEQAGPEQAGLEQAGPGQTAAEQTATKPKKSAKGGKKKAAAAPEPVSGSEDQPDGEAVAPASKTAKKKATSGAKGGQKRAQASERSGEDTPEDDARPEDAVPEADTPTDGAEAGEDTADESGEESAEEQSGEGGARRRSRRRGGRRRRKGSGGGGEETDREESPEAAGSEDDAVEGEADEQAGGEVSSKRRRTRTRTPKSPEDEIASVTGSTRLEAKKQRRREGREAGRRRAPIVSEAEFLARRESVDRVMVIRQRGDLTQIAVLEDKVLVEHYVSRESQTSLIGNVYLGRVQNVLPSMEAAFIDIGKGRNAVLYAGEVNWSALGHKDGEPRKIESVLQSGQTVLVQVTKDPIGHKGARLTGQVSLPGRFLVYVPDGTTSGISRKLPDTERNRLKTLLKQIVPESAGVIVRTAAEGASEDELTQDVERLTARWQDIEAKVKAGRAPELLYGEPDLTLKVVRDLFTEDFSRLVVEGDEAWNLVDGYVAHVAPDLRDRLERYRPDGDDDAADGAEDGDVFASYRIDEQIAKALDRKVWLPSGGSLIIDRTEAMTVVDVNTGKFTGSGGNLEETVTKNNLEAAEEIVRQLRLRDIGGIIVVDFIDMVLESNRDLVLRRLVECLGRDRTRHQVAEVTSLGLVQMTRKRIGTGLLEAFSEECGHCKGRGLVVHDHPIETAGSSATDDEPRRRRSGRGGRGRNGAAEARPEPVKPSPKDLAGTRPPAPTGEESTTASPPDGTAIAEAAPAPEPRSTAAADGAAAVERSAEGAEAPEVEPSPVESSDSAQVEDSTEDEPVSTASEAAVEIPAAPAAPVVVTTTRRRRTATRPAGPPAGEEPTARDGVPVSVGAPVAADAAEALEPAELAADGLDETGQPILHVPVKKKGSRKR